MSKMRFRRISHDRSLDGTRYEKILRADDFGRMRGHSPADVSFLLNESIHFYNYGLYSLMAHMVVVKDKSWKPFNSDTVAKAIEGLYQVSRESLIQMAHNLALMKNGKPVHLPGQVNDEASGWNLNSANTGILAASLWGSNAYRNEKCISLLGEVEANKVYFREFEKLPPKIENLRSFFNKSRIEKIIGNQYSKFISGDIAEYLFQPFWGGSAVIRHNRWNEQNPDPFWPYTRVPIYKNMIGPTEKLYHEAAFDIFEYPQTANPPPDVFLSKVENELSDIKKIMPFNLSDRRLQIWQEWIFNLDLLEQIFLDAVNHPETVYGAKRHPGVLVGLPCAFGFIGLLRAYIVDLMARTLMVAFSHTIMPIYEDVNGYMAVQLWEALTGKEVPSVKSAGALHRWALLGTEGNLKAFREYPVKSWVKKVPEEERARKIFEEKLEAPLIKNGDEYNKKAFYVKQVVTLGADIKFDEWHKRYLPYYPVITSEFYRCFELENNKGRELLYGARLTAQAHIYIAFKLMDKGLKVLELDKAINREKKGECKHRRGLKNFSIGAGSYIWGGKKPPHNTHRHGINFDFSFGPNIPPWPDTKFTKAIEKLKRIPKLKHKINEEEKSGRELIDSIIKSNPKKYGFLTKNVSVVMVCYTNKQGKEPNQRRKGVFKRIMQDIINEEYEKVKKFCTWTIMGNPFDSSEEEEAYQNAEKKLIGTPHFLDPKIDSEQVSQDEITEPSDWQRTHIAHLALMLAAPRTVIFISPIVHLRAMLAIRQAFSIDGLFLFSVNCTDDLVEELDMLNRKQVSDTILILFKENGFPLSEKAYIAVEETSSTWNIINGVNNYKIEEKGEFLKISFIIPQTILKLAAEIVRDTNYAFEPIKHYHHWHMDFCDENYVRYLKYKKWNPGRWSSAVTSMGNIFDRYQELWLFLKIDLSLLINYLEKYSINEKVSSDFYNPLEEKDLLLTKCREYMDECKKRFGEVPNEDSEHETKLSAHQIQNNTISEAIVHRLFSVYQLNSDEGYSEFIKPTIDEKQVNEPWNSLPLQKPITITREVISILKPHLLAHKLVKEKDFSIFELEESDEIPDAPDEEMNDYEERLAYRDRTPHH